MHDRSALRAAFDAALAPAAPASNLDQAVAAHFPDLTTFREGDDLVLLAGETRRLLVRRVGPDRFVAGEVAAASGSTNLLDRADAPTCDLDGLIDDIAAFAAL